MFYWLGHPYNMTGEKGKGDVHGRNSMRLGKTISLNSISINTY